MRGSVVFGRLAVALEAKDLHADQAKFLKGADGLPVFRNGGGEAALHDVAGAAGVEEVSELVEVRYALAHFGADIAQRRQYPCGCLFVDLVAGQWGVYGGVANESTYCRPAGFGFGPDDNRFLRREAAGKGDGAFAVFAAFLAGHVLFSRAIAALARLPWAHPTGLTVGRGAGARKPRCGRWAHSPRAGPWRHTPGRWGSGGGGRGGGGRGGRGSRGGAGGRRERRETGGGGGGAPPPPGWEVQGAKRFG